MPKAIARTPQGAASLPDDAKKPKHGVEVGSTLESQTLFASPYWPDSYRFPYNPDPLVSGNDYSTYDEMLDDDQVKVAVSFKKDLVVNSGWEIVCDDEEIRAAAEKELREIQSVNDLDNSFEDSVRDMLSSFGYGFSLTEPVYKIDGGLYRLSSLKTRAPHGFTFNLDRFGNVLTVCQHTDRGQIELEPRTFLHHVYQPEFGNPYGRSDLRAAHAYWKAKKFVSKFLAIFLERFAGPTVVGKYDPGWDTDQVSRFHNMLKTIQQATSLALPDDAMVEFVQSNKDSSDLYIKALDHYNLSIARAILVPDLMGISGSKTSGGSYSLGQEHFRLFYGTIRKDRDSLARKVTNRVLRPWVRANFGDTPCDFKFLPFTIDDELEYSRLWVEAVKSRVWEPTEDEVNHLRTQLKFPQGAVVLSKPEPVPTGTLGDPAGQPEIKSPEKEPADAEDQEDMSHAAVFRAMHPFERKVDFKAVKRDLDAGEEFLTRRLRTATSRIFNDYVRRVRESGLMRNFRPERLNEIEPKFLKDMRLVVRDYFRDLLRMAYKKAQRELLPDQAPAKFAAGDELLPDEIAQALDAESFGAVGDYKNLMTKRVRLTILEGMKTGLPEGEIIKRVRELWPDESERWVATFVRTKTTEVYNRGRKSYWDNDAVARQVVQGYMFSAILDERTSEVCRFLDGKSFEAGEFTNAIVPALHFNCRSVLVPVTKFEVSGPEDWDDPVPVSRLKDMGGNLILSSSAKTRSMAFGDATDKPLLVSSGEVSGVGDHGVVAPPGPGNRLQLHRLFVSNADNVFPCLAGFKQRADDQPRYVKNLEGGGGTLNMDLSASPWLLDENAGLILWLGSSVKASYTCEYSVLGPDGGRLS